MKFRTVPVLAAVATLAAPSGSPAGDWGHGSGYDVSVELAASASVTLDAFYGPLGHYGDWIDVSGHGHVWRPRVAAGWRPYYYGRWEWTDEGWFWASDEPWGWAAYHYGRWTHDPFHGWLWVPGYEWAPAWVSWRVSGDVVGWAPLAPGISVYVGTFPFVDFWWTFVPTARFVSVPVYTVAYAPSYSRRHWDRTAPAPARPAPRPGYRPAPAPAPRTAGALAWGGPAPRLVEERAGRPLAPVRVVPAPSPGEHRARPGEVAVFRPEPGQPRRPDRAAPPAAPGRGAVQPPPDGRGRGPGPAPAPGGPPPRWEDRGRGSDGGRGQSAPAWRENGGDRGRAPPPAPARGRERSEERREERNGAPPAPRR